MDQEVLDDRLNAQAAYWRAALAGAPGLLDLPTDRRRPAQQDFVGGLVAFELDAALSAELQVLSRRHGLTLFMTLLAGWALVLSRLSGQRDLVIGVPANRSRSDVDVLDGGFANTLALRIDLSGSPSVAGLLDRVKTVCLAAEAHQGLPFERLVELVAPARSLAHSPIFQVAFAWERNAAAEPHLAKFDLTLSLREDAGRITGGLGYAAALFDRATIERWGGYLHLALQAMAAEDGRAASALSLLSAVERQLLLVEWNNTASPYPSDRCIHELFEAQVRRDPTAAAVLFEGEPLSYGALNARANRLAHDLRQRGVRPDTLVALCVERSLEMIVGLLAILKAGGAYVPLDPAYPAERLALMLQDSAPKIILSHDPARPSLDAALAGLGQPPPVLDLLADALWADQPATDLDPASIGLTPRHLAYVIYTSGSTGRPKGVMVEHRHLVASSVARLTAYSVDPIRPLLVSSISFDSSKASLYWPLIAGGQIVLASADQKTLAAAIADNIADHAATILLCTPVLYGAILSDCGDRLKTLQAVIIAGEKFSNDLINQHRLRNPQAALVNEYGPTECTVWASYRDCSAPVGDLSAPPIGRPIANTRIYLLDEHRAPVPRGVVGEIHIGGAGVARGYLNRPDLTAERFIANPFVAGDRLYKTGDLARYLPDGNIEFLGRNDFQVKIRGFRIELGEIEARLAEHPGVREAVVLAREDGSQGKRLVAYYLPATPAPDLADLKAHLAANLPDYMVPAAYMRLATWPVTPNGKLDRNALPAPDGEAYAARIYEPPLGPVEPVLAEIWSQVLGVAQVGRHDNFFDLGGHSLLALKMIAQLRRRLAVEVSLGALFGRPSLSEFAQGLEVGASAALSPIGPAPRQARMPLSFAQQRLWFLSHIARASEAYHVPLALNIEGRLDAAALGRALAGLVRRHETLRTRFVSVAGEGFQVIDLPETAFALTRHDLRGEPVSRAECDRLMQQAASAPFDLERGPLIRGWLIRLAEDEQVLLIIMHHIVSDGWSIGILLRELGALYAAAVAGEDDPLAPLQLHYADYAAWQRQALSGTALDGQAAYWRAALAGAPGLLDLPTDRRRPAQQDFAGGLVALEMDAALSAELKALSRRHGVTLFMTVLAGWALVLSRLSGQQDLVIGAPSANRNQPELDGLIGFFVNTLAVRIDLSGAPSVAALLDRVKSVCLAAQAHQDLPFEQLVELVAPARSLAHSPIFQIAFAWQNNAAARLHLPGLAVTEITAEQRVAKFDLTLSLWEDEGRITGGLEYATALFDRATVERWAGYLHQALQVMAADDRRVASALPLLSAAERHCLLVEWNETPVPYPAERCIHELFEAQVRRDPSAVAVVFEGERLSYGALNARANRLAHHLRQRGVGPDTLVALCVERSIEMVVGLLAVLKAGGAYVPLDPAYPAERLAHMLQDSAPKIIISHGPARPSLDAALAELDQPPLVLDLLADSAWADRPATDPDDDAVGLTPRHLAYVIYTSGSTGRPKGVMVEHHNVTRLFSATESRFRFGPTDIWTLFHSFAFDFSVWEIWGALLYGGRLVIVPAPVTRSPAEFYRLLCNDGVTVLNQTPSAFRALIAAQAGSDATHHLRAVVFGGEALDPAVLRPWYQDDRNRAAALINMYGITETTVHVTEHALASEDSARPGTSPIGRKLPDLRLYLLDEQLQPVPRGAAGEIHVGGAGVARGYLNRPDLTAARFIDSPFVPGDRLYKSGDLARYLPDGTLEFIGRNDFQVKIRGFRIELGEIEARLAEHPDVREAVVLARADGTDGKRLVAYYGAAGGPIEVAQLKAHLAANLPDYMVPPAYVWLDSFPLTQNGKLDRNALPAPDGEAYAARTYEAPLGPVETALAGIWSEVLSVARVGRHDNFFDLGGHSLLAIRVLDRMRRAGLGGDVRALFQAPDLAALAEEIGAGEAPFAVPVNALDAGCPAITPEKLSLIDLTQLEIDRIVTAVPGGIANIQDIYPLAPLQEGILFHHMMAQTGDVYLLLSELSFTNRDRLDAYAAAMNAVIARHDILRTAVLWEGLSAPVQVVLRATVLPVEEVALDPAAGNVAAQLRARFDPRRHRLDVRRAPLMRLVVAHDPVGDRWVGLWLLHHLAVDHSALELIRAELQAHLLHDADRLPTPAPFRNFVARARLMVSAAEHEGFFRRMLAGVDEPTAPFGLLNVLGDGADVREAGLAVEPRLGARLRARARLLGVSATSLFHVAWGLVLARASGQTDPVFGTVLFGRMQGGEDAERALGLFINTLPVRLLLGAIGAERSVRETHRILAELMRHELAPLAVAQRCSGLDAQMPLFTALLNYRHEAAPSERGVDAAAAWQGIEHRGDEERTNYPLTLSVDDLGSGFRLTAQAVDCVAPERICAMVHRALESLAEALEHRPEQPVGHLDVLPAAEHHGLLVALNDTMTAAPSASCVHELFEAQVARDPTAIAVVFGEEWLSYGELDVRANRLAHHLRSLGVGPDRLVALCVERSLEMVVGLLAILKAGGAYVPLDPAYPAERLGYVLADSAPGVALTHAPARSALQAAMAGLDRPPPILDLIGDAASWAEHPATAPDRADLGRHHLAYVIYTSGSTGRPKGVMVEHRSVVNFLATMAQAPGLGAEDVLLAVTTLAFDIAGLELHLPLSRGARIVLASRDDAADADALARLLDRHAVTVMQATPATWRLLLNNGWHGRAGLTVLCGGEALPAELASRLASLGGTVWNLYGPTETTIWSTRARIDGAPSGPMTSIGRPIANTRIYLLDNMGQPVPLGVAGEIHVGGAGVARGYLNRPELTEERFIDSAFVPGDRLYKTGDLGRYLPDGSIEFLGRNDFQVKLRGFRIELGEIEARLAEHPGVREALVLARADGTGETGLVAYYIPTSGRETEIADLKVHLAALLPDYMVPAAYLQLETWPLTPNGKLDRKALPAPDGSAFSTRGYVAPVGPLEQTLAELWSQALCVERIGRHDNFFDLGGQSLLAMRLVSRIRSVFKVELPLRALFEAPSVAALAPRLDRADAARPALAARARPDVVPLSFAQRRLWLLGQIEGRGPTYNIPLALRLDGKLDAAALEAALSDLVARHESLRTVFEERDGTALQRVLPVAAARVAFERVNAGEVTLPDLLAQAAGYGFDLAAELPIRASLFRLGAERHVLLLLLHHIAGDGWSLAPLARDLASAYGARHRGEAPGWAALPVQYVDYTLWQHELLGREEDPESRIAQQLGYWRTQLANLPEQIELPSDRPRPAVASRRGGLFTFSLDAALHGRLLALARTGQASLFMVLQAGLAALLSRLGAGTDIVLGSPIAGRVDDALEDLVGFFVNTLVLRTDLSGDPSAKALLARVREVDLGGYAHQDLPFERLVELLNPPRSLGRHPLFQIMLVLQNNAGARFELPGLNAAAEPVGTGTTKFDLTFGFAEQQRADGTAQGLEASIEYATDLFDRSSIETLAERLIRMLSAMAAAPDQAISRIELLAPSERQRLLVDWNDTAQPLPEATLPALFEAQVARDPSAIAVVFGEERLSYGELDVRANRLAHHLRSLGVGPDRLVALCVERSLEMVVGLLAILKAGGAYVPLDPAYPAERLGYVLADSAPGVALTHAPARSALQAAMAGLDRPPPILDLIGDAASWAEHPATAPNRADLGPHHLAYVIYTSGSTGKPKGVMVEHRSVVNFLATMAQAPGLGAEDVLLAVTTLAFDIAGLELHLPLSRGARIVLASRDDAADADALAQLLDRHAVTVMQATPATWRLLLNNGWHGRAGLTVLCGGEALPAELASRLAGLGGAVWNLYGPTETTIWSTRARVDGAPGGATTSIGRPIANTRIYLLDGLGQPVPLGVAGEIHIGGAGVARGYLNRPELTAERFIDSPLVPGDRLYKTGDLGRYLPDGSIEFLGRNDFQVKLRGFRIELGEIEARLAEHPGVREALVSARDDAPGEMLLVAYYIPSAGTEPEIADLKAHLAALLPDYMVPAAYLRLASWPLTPNGKLDRKALPAPDGAAYATRGYVAPVGSAEQALAELWSEVLGVEKVGRHDSFFDLGGHSLMATRLVSRIRATIGLDLPLRLLFEAPSIQQIVGHIDAMALLAPLIEPAQHDEIEEEVGVL